MKAKSKTSAGRERTAPSGIMLYAKSSGITSFSSLYSIKHALGTEKVGHTGTLDSFADGLLVVLAGSLTHLVPHITGFKKAYKAVVCFGKETDTLDPEGEITATGKAPSREEVEEALKSFTGALLQVPPVYSAVHVDGKRASSLARDGKEIALEPRQIFVYENNLLDFKADEGSGCSYALLEIKCSKGTYIRALARDIAKSLGTCGHLSALRRTEVGPFKLEDAACYSELKDFTIEAGIESEKKIIETRKLSQSAEEKKEKKQRIPDSTEKILDIKKHFLFFTPELAVKCGFQPDIISEEWVKNWLNGRPLVSKSFKRLNRSDFAAEGDDLNLSFPDEIAVFYENRQFAGMMKIVNGRLNYGFVVPPAKESTFRTFNWEDVVEGRFPVEYLQSGTALTVGSFDGMHSGHAELVKSVRSAENLYSGLVTFRTSYKAVENSSNSSAESSYAGDVMTLRQKLDRCRELGLDFAIVIDFSEEISKIEGRDFIELLCNNCGMKYMAEGQDFRCGYKGAFSMKELKECSKELSFKVVEVEDVIYENQRISSSRIRKAVKKGSLLEVQKMLGTPYCIDCEGLDWQKGSAAVLLQVLPADGNYDCVVMIKGDSDEFTAEKSVCAVEKGCIKLALEDSQLEKVSAVNFVPVNKANYALA